MSVNGQAKTILDLIRQRQGLQPLERQPFDDNIDTPLKTRDWEKFAAKHVESINGKAVNPNTGRTNQDIIETLKGEQKSYDHWEATYTRPGGPSKLKDFLDQLRDVDNNFEDLFDK